MTPKQKKLVEQIRAKIAEHDKHFENLFALGRDALSKLSDSELEKLDQKSISPEVEQAVAGLEKLWNRHRKRPLDLCEAELTRRVDLQDKNRKRQAGIVSANETRQQKAEGDYRLYREFAE
jgi:hypothetical protein